MSLRNLKREDGLYAAAFLLALVIRLAGAERLALSDREAELALQALGLARGQALLIGPHPAYLALTTLWMFIFQGSNWVARFWPALSGSLLVLLPLLFRSRLGRLPALLLAFFLALDPGMLAVSRQAGSLALAIFFALLALGLWINGRSALAGIAGGMLLLSGPAIWPGVLGLGLAILVARGALTRRPVVAPPPSAPATPPPAEERQPARSGARRGLLFGLVTVFIAGTLFFSIPNGLSAMGASLPAYVQGWAAGGGVAAPLLVGALLAYEFFPLVFGLWGGIRSLLRQRPAGPEGLDRFLLAWWALALILALAYPGRQVQDLAWSLLPLWALAARQTARLVRIPAADRPPVLGQMALTAVILVYLLMQLVTIANTTISSPLEYQVRLAGGLVMLAACTVLIAWGWARWVALRGMVLGAGLVFLVYLLAAGWNAGSLSPRAGDELWSSGPQVRSADLILETIDDLSQWGPTRTGGPDVVVVDIAAPALRWLLRGVEQVSYLTQEPANGSPAILITSAQTEPALAATYRGEGFVLSETVNWNAFQLKDWFRWTALRIVPGALLRQERVILWARTDLFPGGQQGQPGGKPANP